MKKNTGKPGLPLHATGRLFIIGGKAKRCLTKFVKLAGGKAAHILVIPYASSIPVEVCQDLDKDLRKKGVTSITFAVAGQPLVIDDNITGIYMTGGDQSDLIARLGEDGAGTLRRFYSNGGLIGGTSAGAAAVGFDIITGGMDDKLLREGKLTVGKSLGLLANIIVDTHFLTRARFNRLLAACQLFPGALGIGLDEDTGLLIEGDTMTVFGAGHVWFFKGGTAVKPSAKKAARMRSDFLYSVLEASVSVLSAGEVYAPAR